LVELTIRELEHRARDPASRVVDPDVDAAECAQRLIAKAIDIRSPRYVGANRDNVRLHFMRDGVERCGSARGEDEIVSFASEVTGECSADSGARSGDDDGLHGAGSLIHHSAQSSERRTL